jgi:hypothetical protein
MPQWRVAQEIRGRYEQVKGRDQPEPLSLPGDPGKPRGPYCEGIRNDAVWAGPSLPRGDRPLLLRRRYAA